MRRVTAVVIGSLILIVVALAITLASAPIAVSRTNTNGTETLAGIAVKTSFCQSREIVPAQTSAIRLHAFMFAGARVTLQLWQHGKLIGHGERGSGWTGGAVTVPVSAITGRREQVLLCFTLHLTGYEEAYLDGLPVKGALATTSSRGTLPGRVTVEDLRPGSSSWASLSRQVARRMGLGHFAAGGWLAVLAAALMVGVVGLTSRVALRGLQ